MDCPKDWTPLEVVHFHSIPIHRCPKCEGTWYETDQLRILKDKEAHGDYCWINLDLWRDAPKFQAASTSRYTCARLEGNARANPTAYGCSRLPSTSPPDALPRWRAVAGSSSRSEPEGRITGIPVLGGPSRLSPSRVTRPSGANPTARHADGNCSHHDGEIAKYRRVVARMMDRLPRTSTRLQDSTRGVT